MSEAFSRPQIDAVAALAQLELSPTEAASFARELGDILEYVRQIQSVDTTGVEPTSSVALEHESDRADVVSPCLARQDVLAGAADAAPVAGFFKVPRVIG
jgi:aspartyl-tRNA(Asn)/glutamyl-tRNA(Gln) amidotransferase subunit C